MTCKKGNPKRGSESGRGSESERGSGPKKGEGIISESDTRFSSVFV